MEFYLEVFGIHLEIFGIHLEFIRSSSESIGSNLELFGTYLELVGTNWKLSETYLERFGLPMLAPFAYDLESVWSFLEQTCFDGIFVRDDGIFFVVDCVFAFCKILGGAWS